MDRNEKLERRLRDLEVEYRKLLEGELEEMAGGGYSPYLHDREPKYPVGKLYRRGFSQLTKLEAEIVELSGKLGADIGASAVPIAREFSRRFLAAWEGGWGGWWKGEQTATAKDLLEKLRSLPAVETGG